MADEVISRVNVGDWIILYGCSNKMQANQRYDFGIEFDSAPVVLISPFWENVHSNVGHAETLSRIESDHFILTSNNGHPSYFVNWMAVGTRSGVETPFLSAIAIDDLILQFGSQIKSEPVEHTYGYSAQYATEVTPFVVVSPYWRGSAHGVGHEETLSYVNDTAFSVYQHNWGDDFFVQYLAAGAVSAIAHSVGRFQIDEETVMHIGRVNKVAETARVSFSRSFDSPPVILINAEWSNDRVGRAETIKNIDADSFTVVSGNAASNYFVNWIAIGRGTA